MLGCSQTPRDHSESTMTSDFFDMLTEQPVAAEEVPIVIRDTDVEESLDSSQSETPPAAMGYTRSYANEAANSRSATALPEGNWVEDWRAELAAGLSPLFVLYGGRAIVLPGPFQWQLFDIQGNAHGVGALGMGQTVLDLEHGLFIGPGPTGVVTAWSLSDGSKIFSLLVATDDAFRQALLARRGERLLVVSVEYKAEPHGGHQPEESLVEVYELGPSEPVDEIGLLKWARVEARLRRESPLLLAALHEESVVMASKDRIFVADWHLEVSTTLEEAFIPLSMSLDEAGRIYLVVLQRKDDAPERRALWVIDREGNRLLDVTLPAAASDAYAPPIVGYDHRAYLFQGDRVLSISPDGGLRERVNAGGPVAGGLATSDGGLLVAAGGILSVFDSAGERRVLYVLDDDQWVTPPALTSEGRLLIASERYLYCLRAMP